MHHVSKPSRAMLGLCLGMVAAFFLHAAACHASDATMSKGETDAHAGDCFSCHAVDHALVGPAYRDVAKRYAGQGDAAVATLVSKIKQGGAGNWGQVPMPAHPGLSDADATAMVTWILSLTRADAASPAAAGNATSPAAMPTHTNQTYRDIYGRRVQTDVAVFTAADQTSVTPAVLDGYRRYNAYCSRCHGVDAIGGEYAPDLRKSFANGMTYTPFLGTAMTGRQAKGMPSWAGVIKEKDIRAIYDYIKARQIDLIPRGRPPSA